MSGDPETLRIMEVVLTAEIFNQNPGLDINDLTPACREIFRRRCCGRGQAAGLCERRADQAYLAVADAHVKLAANPFIAYEEFGQRLRITALEPAAQWFLKQGGKPLIEKNPVLAFFFENLDSPGYPTRRSGRQIPRTRIPRRTLTPGSRNW